MQNSWTPMSCCTGWGGLCEQGCYGKHAFLWKNSPAMFVGFLNFFFFFKFCSTDWSKLLHDLSPRYRLQHSSTHLNWKIWNTNPISIWGIWTRHVFYHPWELKKLSLDHNPNSITMHCYASHLSPLTEPDLRRPYINQTAAIPLTRLSVIMCSTNHTMPFLNIFF